MLDCLTIGSIGDWLTGVALLLTALTLHLEYRRRRRRHAEAVHVVPVSGYRFSKGNSSSEIRYWLSNGNDMPAYDLGVALMPWEWKEGAEPLSSVVHEFLPPRPLPPVEADDLYGLNASELTPPDAGFKSAPLRLTFTDCTGRRWRREPDMRLRRAKRRRRKAIHGDEARWSRWA